MFKFKKGRRKDFKTEEAYLGDVFERNRTKLTEVFGGKGAKQRFIANVQAQKEIHDTSVTGALKKLARTQRFTPTAELFKENAIEGLKKFDMYRKFRNLTRNAKGQFTAIDMDKFVYQGDGVYLYDNKVTVVYKNSPEGIDVY